MATSPVTASFGGLGGTLGRPLPGRSRGPVVGRARLVALDDSGPSRLSPAGADSEDAAGAFVGSLGFLPFERTFRDAAERKGMACVLQPLDTDCSFARPLCNAQSNHSSQSHRVLDVTRVELD